MVLKPLLSIAALLLNIESGLAFSMAGHNRDIMLDGNSQRTESDWLAEGWTTDQWFSTKLDHFEKTTSKWFQLRYWTNEDKFDRQNGAIFLYICGEWTCRPPDVKAAAMAYGHSKNGILIALEHRYYGDSQPFDDWSTPNLKWLNSTQALEDIHKFINYMKLVLDRKMDRKVMIVGGSYPGAMVAWYQHLYDDVTMVWSSSGVVDAIEDFKMYDYGVYEATNKTPECSEGIQAINKHFDDLFQRGNLTEITELMKYFNVENLTISSADFMNFLGDVFATGVQRSARVELCEEVNTQQGVDDPKPWLKDYSSIMGVDLADYDLSYFRNTTIDTSKASRQWVYQTCTEFGYFQTPNTIVPMRSQLINITYWNDLCRQIYGDSISGVPDTAMINAKYGALNNQGKNVYFVNSIDDSWRYAGIRNISDPEEHPTQKALVIDCADCSHCKDLKVPTDDDPAALTAGRDEITKQMDIWLAEPLRQDRIGSADMTGMEEYAKMNKLEWLPENNFLQ